MTINFLLVNADLLKGFQRELSQVHVIFVLFQGYSDVKESPQAFIQALFSTVVFRQRFSFFTVYLVQWLHGVSPWYTAKGKFFEI